MMLFPPDLSGDVWRYLWDGTVSVQGINPYSVPPDHPSLEPSRTPWHHQINHPEVHTIYPPYAQLLFLISALAGGSLMIWRTILLLFEIAAIRLLYEKSPGVALLWVTFPLAVWEGFWSAHIDLVVGTLLLAAVVLASRPLLSGVLLGIATGVKLVPIVALPVFLTKAGRPLHRLGAFMIIILLGVAPFAGGSFMAGFGTYAERWSFNGPIYLPLVSMIEALSIEDFLRAVWTAIHDVPGLEALSASVYGILYPAFIARVILGIAILTGIAFLVKRSSSLPVAVVDSLGLLLLLSPTVHPWYWLPVVLIALLAARRIWIFLACGSPLSYLVYEGAEPALVLGVSYGIPLAAYILLHGRSGTPPEDQENSFRGISNPGSSIID